MEVSEMRMLSWMRDKTMKDKIRNGRFQEHLEVVSIGDKVRKTHLKWFGHVQQRSTTIPIKKSLAKT